VRRDRLTRGWTTIESPTGCGTPYGREMDEVPTVSASERNEDRREEAPRSTAARGRDLGAAALALLALIWGYNWVVMKIGLGYAQPFAFSALRTFLGALSLFLLLIVLRRSLRPQAVGFTIIIGLLQTTAFVGLLMWALQSGGAGKTSVLTYTMPFWLLLLAWVFLGERLRGTQWLAVGSPWAASFSS
jgi:uncharacterized membrane protein